MQGWGKVGTRRWVRSGQKAGQGPGKKQGWGKVRARYPGKKQLRAMNKLEIKFKSILLFHLENECKFAPTLPQRFAPTLLLPEPCPDLAQHSAPGLTINFCPDLVPTLPNALTLSNVLPQPCPDLASVDYQVTPYHSQPPIYRACKGQGLGPVNQGGSVNRGMIHTDLHVKRPFGRKELGSVNRGTQ